MKLKISLAVSLLSLLLGVAAGAADWNSAKTLYPGIKLLEVKKTKPRLLRLFIMRIDLKTPGLTFAVTGRAGNWGKPMPDYPKLPIRTRRATTGEFMRECRNPVAQGGRGLNMVVAVNASPWTPWAPPFTHKFADPPGLNISDGVIVGNRRGNNPVFVVYRDGSVDIVSKVPRSDIPRIKDAVSGFFLLVKNGKVLPDTGVTSRECHPRTAYGLSADRRYLYIMALDGRQRKWSLGATGSETGRFMLEAGASDVINMDGGGSTTLCYWDKRRKKPVMVNRQSSTGNSMRPVATNLGIVLNRK